MHSRDVSEQTPLTAVGYHCQCQLQQPCRDGKETSGEKDMFEKGAKAKKKNINIKKPKW